MQVSWVGQHGDQISEIILKWSRDIKPLFSYSKLLNSKNQINMPCYMKLTGLPHEILVLISYMACTSICQHEYIPYNQISEKFCLVSYPSVKICVLDAQKNGFIETVLLSTHKICFG